MKQKKHKMAPKKDNSKTMDVSKPGRSTPDTSARPVIVTNRSIVQDPTLKDDSKDDSKQADKTFARGEKTIAPVSKMTPEDSTTDESKPAETPAPQPATPEKTDTEKERAKEAAVVDAVADQATEDKKKQNKDSDAEIARKKALEKLVADKKYFVPIGQVSRRRNRRALVVLFVLLILAAGAYLAVDAGMIDIGTELPVDIIKT